MDYNRIMRLPLIFCLSSFIYAASVFSSPVNQCEQQKCLIVVDVGSTGSRLHSYSYDLDETNSPVKITERFSKKIKPGLATLEPNKTAVDAYLTTLFAGAPPSQAPVYFYATAGMRTLSQDKQQKLYSLVNNWFQSNTTWQLASAKTIKGSDEGAYGWLALNYQLNNLSTNKPESLGYMDMGGASIEIAFPVSNTMSQEEHKNIKVINLYGHRFNVFVYSFLGLGQNEVLHQFLETDSCFINDYEMPNGDKAHGDAYLCKKEVSSLIKAHQVSQTIQPALNNSPVSRWYTTGGLAFLVKSPPFNFTTHPFTPEELLSQADSAACHQNWQDLSNQYPSDEYLYSYCFSPAYYYALLENYGIRPDQTINYLADNQNVDWTLGVVLEEKPN